MPSQLFMYQVTTYFNRLVGCCLIAAAFAVWFVRERDTSDDGFDIW